MNSIPEYPKRGKHIIGYRFTAGDKPESSCGYSLYHANIELREFVVCDYATEIADCVRHGGSGIDYLRDNATAVRRAGSGEAKYLKPIERSHELTVYWQANEHSTDGVTDPDPYWYGARIQYAGLTTWVGRIVQRIARHAEQDHRYGGGIRPADIIDALRPVYPVAYVSESYGDWIIDPAPDFAPRQLTHVHAEAPAAPESESEAA